MRRPLCLLAAAFTSGIFIRYLFIRAVAAGVVSGLLLMVLFVLFLSGEQTRSIPMEDACERSSVQRHSGQMLLAAGMVLLGIIVMQGAVLEAAVDPYVQMDGKAVRIHGLVLSAEPQRAVVLTDDGSRVLLKWYGELHEEVDEGREVTAAGQVELPSAARNPGCFNYAQYLAGRRIYACVRVQKLECGAVKSRWRYFIACRRGAFEEAVAPYLNEEQRAVLSAMLFGDKSTLPEETYEQFRRNGTAHALAVSGLHVGMVYGLYIWLFGKRRSVFGCLVLWFFLLCYAALAGFSPSVVRAGVMIGVHAAGCALHRRYDMLTGIAVSALLILSVSPYQLFESGFQLSFMAVLLLGFLQPVCDKRWLPAFFAWMRRRGLSVQTAGAVLTASRWLLPLFLMQTGMVPLTAYLFNYISLQAYFANLPLLVLAGLVVPAGIVLLCLLILPGSAVFVPMGGLLLARLVSWLLFWNRLSYMDDLWSFDVISPPRWMLFVLYGTGLFLLSEWAQIRFSRRQWRFLLLTAFVMVTCAVAGAAVLSDGFGGADVVFVDVGQGDCVHIRCGDGVDLLIDGGGKADYDVGRKTVKPYLLKNRVRCIDTAIVTHLDTDHYGGIVSLCQDGMVRTLVLYEGLEEELPKIMQETGLARERILLVGAGDTFAAGQATVRFLGPLDAGITDSENEKSFVMSVEIEDRKILVTGDIGSDTEEMLAANYTDGELDADILQIPHHGSRYSSSQALILAVSPEMAVAQVGRNTYGHPAPEVLERYRQNGTAVYRNDQDGAVGVDLDRMQVMTMLH